MVLEVVSQNMLRKHEEKISLIILRVKCNRLFDLFNWQMFKSRPVAKSDKTCFTPNARTVQFRAPCNIDAMGEKSKRY